jgi:hypothetical protein
VYDRLGIFVTKTNAMVSFLMTGAVDSRSRTIWGMDGMNDPAINTATI